MRDDLGGLPRGVAAQLTERLARGSEQGIGSDGSTGGLLHPHIGRHVADHRAALELGPDLPRLLHLLFDLEGDHVADRIVGQIEK